MVLVHGEFDDVLVDLTTEQLEDPELSIRPEPTFVAALPGRLLPNLPVRITAPWLRHQGITAFCYTLLPDEAWLAEVRGSAQIAEYAAQAVDLVKCAPWAKAGVVG